MRANVIFCLLLLLSLVSPSLANLAKAVDKLSSVARLTNWISIQTELMGDAGRIVDVSAELVGVESAKVLDEMASVSVVGIADELEKLQKIHDAIKGKRARFTTQPIVDALLAERANAAKNTMGVRGFERVAGIPKSFGEMLNVTQFNVLPAMLETLLPKPNTGPTAVPGDFKQKMLEAKDNLAGLPKKALHYYMEVLMGNSSDSTSDSLKEFNEVLEHFRKASEYFDEFTIHLNIHDAMNNQSMDAMEVELKALEERLSGTAPLELEVRNMEETAKRLEKVLGALEAMYRPSSTECPLTVGLLPERDLTLVAQDLQDPWVRQAIAQGRDVGALEKAFASLPEFTRHVQSVKLFLATPFVNTSIFPQQLANVSAEGSDKLHIQEIVDQIRKARPCLKAKFVEIDDPVFLGHIAKGIYRNAHTLIGQIAKFMRTLDDGRRAIRNNPLLRLDNNNPLLDNLQSILSKVTDTNAKKTAQEVVKLGVKPLREMMTAFRSVETLVGELLAQSKDLNEQLKLQPDDIWYDLDRFNNLVLTYKVGDVLECFTWTFPEDAIQRAVSFSDHFEAIGGNLNEAIKQLRAIPALQETLLSVKKMPADGKAPQVLQLSEQVGRGVGALKRIRNAFEKREALRKCANSPPQVNDVIRKNQSAQQTWTPETIDGIGKMVAALETLSTAAEPMVEGGTLSAVWQLLAGAEAVPGVTVDPHLFEEPIASDLIATDIPELRTVADNFIEISALELDFAASRKYLAKATMSLADLEKMFGSFFEQKTPQVVVKAIEKTTSVSLVGPILVALGFVLLILLTMALLVVMAYFGYKKYKKRFRWSDRDIYWSHAGLRRLIEGETERSNLVLAVASGKMEPVKALLETGAYVDIVYNDSTPLHTAVDASDPELVGLLIRSGANRNATNSEHQTARQRLAQKLKQPGNEYKATAKLKACEAVFAKFERKKFRPKLPQLLSTNYYTICLSGVPQSETVTRFKTAFESNVVDEDSNKPITHIVVHTNADGVYDADERILGNDLMMIEALLPIFTPCVLVGSSWLAACVRNKEKLHSDYEHRVRKVKFNGKVFESVDEWKRSAHRSTIPYLFGVNVQFVPKTQSDAVPFKALVEAVGAKWHQTVLNNAALASLPPPLFHPTLKPRLIVHGQDTDATLQSLFQAPPAAEPQTEFTVMKLPELFEFLLARPTSEEDGKRGKKAKK